MARSKTNRSSNRPNVVHRGQRAVLNGKPVIADGKGNWVSKTPGTYGNAQYGGKKAGSYKPGEQRKSTPTKATPTNSRSNTTAAANTRIKKQAAERKAALERTRGNNNSQILRPAPAASKPTPTRTPAPTRTQPAATKPTPTKPAATKPADKKPAATEPRKPRTWLKDNYKSGGPVKEALKVKPKKKRLTNKQRKQGGFH